MGKGKGGGPAVHRLGLSARALGRPSWSLPPSQTPNQSYHRDPPTKTGRLRGIACPRPPRVLAGHSPCLASLRAWGLLPHSRTRAVAPQYWGCQTVARSNLGSLGPDSAVQICTGTRLRLDLTLQSPVPRLPVLRRGPGSLPIPRWPPRSRVDARSPLTWLCSRVAARSTLPMFAAVLGRCPFSAGHALCHGPGSRPFPVGRALGAARGGARPGVTLGECAGAVVAPQCPCRRLSRPVAGTPLAAPLG